MKYGLLALLFIGLLPACTCGRKKSNEKTHKKMRSSKKAPRHSMMTPQERAMEIQNEMLESDVMQPGMQF